MALDITGKIVQIMEPVKGTSKAGKDWVKQEFVVETQETYPKKICIGMMGDKTNELGKFRVEDTVKVSLNLESREYNGKWYTNVNAWRIEAASTATASAAPTDNFHADSEPSFTPDAGGSDDLPF
jgi:hypothetical protein